MTNFTFAMVTGVVSGLLATLIIIVFAKVWAKIVEPWYENLVYKDAKIEGRWRVRGTFDFKDQGRLEEEFVWALTRVGHTIRGTSVCTSGPDTGRVYDILGVFRNLLLTCSYTAQDPAALDRGTITLMLVNNGQTFRGHCLYYCYLDHDIRSCFMECERESSGFTPPNLSLQRTGGTAAPAGDSTAHLGGPVR